jgi:hypothetical protein
MLITPLVNHEIKKQMPDTTNFYLIEPRNSTLSCFEETFKRILILFFCLCLLLSVRHNLQLFQTPELMVSHNLT